MKLKVLTRVEGGLGGFGFIVVFDDQGEYSLDLMATDPGLHIAARRVARYVSEEIVAHREVPFELKKGVLSIYVAEER